MTRNWMRQCRDFPAHVKLISYGKHATFWKLFFLKAMQKTFVEKKSFFHAWANRCFLHENLIAAEWAKIHNRSSRLDRNKCVQHEISKTIDEARHISVPSNITLLSSFFLFLQFIFDFSSISENWISQFPWQKVSISYQRGPSCKNMNSMSLILLYLDSV